MDAQINQLIAKRVEERRTRLGMTLGELARASGLPSSTLDRLERQSRGCSAADLWRLARVLEVSITDLCPAPPIVRLIAAPDHSEADDGEADDPGADDQDGGARSWRETQPRGPAGRGPRGRMN